MSLLVEAEHLSRFYGKHCAVDDISFNLSKGQVLGLLGVNGAGKTTTMQMLCGSLAPSSGQIRLHGFDLFTHPTKAKCHLGYLPDTPPLYKELTVREFLRYCGQLHGIVKQTIEAAVDRALQRCDLSEVANKLIGNLSKGFQQRVGIAQAILHNPAIIVLDEPTSGLDPVQIKEIRALIRELGQDHGVIFSTHILPEAMETCTHVQIIHQGRLILHETVNGLYRQMNSDCLQILTRHPPDIDRIALIPGIADIEHITGNRYRVRHSPDNSPAEQIAELISASGWGLQELTPEKISMEDFFIALTEKNTRDKPSLTNF